MTTAKTPKAGPPPMTRLNASSTRTTKTTKPPTSRMDRRLFWATWSYTRGQGPSGAPGGSGSRRGGGGRRRLGRRGAQVDPGGSVEADGHGPTGRVGRLEVLTLGEAEATGDGVGREALDLGVVANDGVVVELPRIGDPALGAGELLLQVEEALVRLQVRVGLRQGEDALQGAADRVLGLGLL